MQKIKIKTVKKLYLQILLILFICGLFPSCSNHGKIVQKTSNDSLEMRNYQKWEDARKHMLSDGYGKETADGKIKWKPKIKNYKLKILNRKQIKHIEK